MNAILVNDTSTEMHTGCIALMSALCGGFAMHGVNIRFRAQRGLPPADAVGAMGSLPDICIINGEGSLHHDSGNTHFLWSWLAYNRAHSIPTVLVNSVWDSMRPTAAQRDLLNDLRYVSCRESNSQASLAEAYDGYVNVVPDAIFLHHYCSGVSEGNGATLYCPGVNDPQTYRDMPTLLIQQHSPLDLQDWMARLMNYDRLLTGRFHAACIALICGMPVYCVPSSSHKMEGLAEDSGAFTVYPNLEAAETSPLMPDVDAGLMYVERARQEIHEMLYAVKHAI